MGEEKRSGDTIRAECKLNDSAQRSSLLVDDGELGDAFRKNETSEIANDNIRYTKVSWRASTESRADEHSRAQNAARLREAVAKKKKNTGKATSAAAFFGAAQVKKSVKKAPATTEAKKKKVLKLDDDDDDNDDDNDDVDNGVDGSAKKPETGKGGAVRDEKVLVADSAPVPGAAEKGKKVGDGPATQMQKRVVPVQKTRTTMDDSGYFVTETYTEYVEVEEEVPVAPAASSGVKRSSSAAGANGNGNNKKQKKKKAVKAMKQRGIGSFFKAK